MATFRQSLQNIIKTRWSGGFVAQRLIYSVGIVIDAQAQKVLEGVRARFPAYAPDDAALLAIGRDRRIPRGVDETVESYVRRLIGWLDSWRYAGIAFAMLRQLQGYLGPLKMRTVDINGNWYSIDEDGVETFLANSGGWDWDDLPDTDWSRFWVIIYGLPNGSAWGDGIAYGDGSLWGTDVTPEQVQTVRAIVKQWKPAGTTCVNIVQALDDTSFDPPTPALTGAPDDGRWDLWWKDVPIYSGVVVASRLGTARYWDGV